MVSGSFAPWCGAARRYAAVKIDYATSTPLVLAFHRLVTADALIMSMSALSMAAALLNDGIVVFPSCYFRRPLPNWRVRECGDAAD